MQQGLVGVFFSKFCFSLFQSVIRLNNRSLRILWEVLSSSLFFYLELSLYLSIYLFIYLFSLFIYLSICSLEFKDC